MNHAFTVTKITSYIRDMFTQDFVLNKVSVVGEISNCKYHQSGHIYFTLKDDKSSIACVMFASDRIKGLDFNLTDGCEVEVQGRINIYEKTGVYQLYATKIKRQGDGVLYEKYLELKNRLEEMGMFAPQYKQPISKYIHKLGVVTAPTGAAVRDIINITTRRNPYVQIILYPALVQGEGAAPSIVKGIQTLEKAGVDVMIVGRGGGSIEDLWAFNEEIVAQAIFDCSVPIISAVGHETDFTIADFVADLRASTPSAGAELAVYPYENIFSEVERYEQLLTSAMYECIRDAYTRSERYNLRLKVLSPQNQLNQKKQYSMNLEDKLEAAWNMVADNKKHMLQVYIARMKGLSPLDKLSQGYSVASDMNNKRIHSVGDVNTGDAIKLYVSDGYIGARVEAVYEQGKGNLS